MTNPPSLCRASLALGSVSLFPASPPKFSGMIPADAG